MKQVLLVFVASGQPIKEYDSNLFRLIEHNQYLNYNRILNEVIENVDHEYLALVHNDTIVTKNWLTKALDVFEDYKQTYISNTEDSSLIDLVGVSPYQSYNEHWFLVYKQIDRLLNEIKPPTKTNLQQSQIEEILLSLFPSGLEVFAKQVFHQADSWYSFVPEMSSSCGVLNLRAFKRVCRYFDERFLGAGGEIRFACRQLAQAGYLFARVDNSFVYHHGNLTNDGPEANYEQLQ